MLICADLFEKLDFSALMEVYEEGNLENAEYFYPNEPPERRSRLAERDFRQYLLENFYQIAGAKYWIWSENGRYFSALRLEPYEDGLLLEALETRPDCRRMGYAKKLLTAVLEQLPAGTPVYSHVSKKNAPSLAVHHSNGFVKILDYVVESDGTISAGCVTLKVTV